MALSRVAPPLLALLMAFGLVAGCSAVLGIQDFSPADDAGNAVNTGDSGPSGRRDGGQIRDATGDRELDARADREEDAGRDGRADAARDARSDHDEMTDADNTDAVVEDASDAEADASDSGCTTTVTGLGMGGTFNWADDIGGTGVTQPTSVAFDLGSGDVVLAGFFTGTTNFGRGLVTAGDAGSGAYLARFDPTGANEWADVFTSDGGISLKTIAIDGSGDTVMAGLLIGTTNLGGGPLTAEGAESLVLAKFDKNGALLWPKLFSAGLGARISKVAVDATGDIYVVGDLDSVALDLGCASGSIASDSAEFVAEFDPTGTCLWSKGFGASTTANYVYSLYNIATLALDPSGNVFVVGGFNGTLNFGKGNVTASGAGVTNIFIQKLTPSGQVLWVKNFGTGASVAPTGVGTDCQGNLLLDGTFYQTLNFGCDTLTESGETNEGDIFLAKLNSSGNCVWSHSFGDPGAQAGGALAVDAFGGPAITGSFQGSVDFGGSALTGGVLNASQSQDTQATYIAKYDSEGHYAWAYGGGGPASNAQNSVGLSICASDNAVVAAGDFEVGTLSLAGDPLTASGTLDTYIVSFAR